MTDLEKVFISSPRLIYVANEVCFVVVFQVANNVVTTHKETVMVSKEITDRSLLSDSAASLCSKSRIFQVAQLPSERIEVTKGNNLHESKCSILFLTFICLKLFRFKPCVPLVLF